MLLLGILIGLLCGALFSSTAIVLSLRYQALRVKSTAIKPSPNPNICTCNDAKSFHNNGNGFCCKVNSWGTVCKCRIFVPQIEEDPFIIAARKELGSQNV